MATSTLAAIQNKVRKLTRSPSVAQLSINDLNEYINTFVLYDFPEHLRLFTLRRTFTFYTNPNQDVYETNTTDPTDLLYNFKNKYVSVHEPIYVAGYQALYQQSRETFFNIYPQTNLIQSTNLTGDGATVIFAGTLSSVPVLRNHVTFGSIDVAGNGLVLYDNGDGTLSGSGTGTINYVSGAYSLTWNVAPGSGEDITSETIPYQAARPQAVLFFNNKFTLRPVPDKVYPVDMEVFVRPTELMTGETPELEQWWQYIAIKAAQKVFLDRMDIDSYNLIAPMAREQELLVLRRTIMQNTNERTATIYTEASEFGLRGGWGSGYY